MRQISAKGDLLKIREEFERHFKERTEEINCSLLAMLAGEHVLFLGPPGTAKSLLSKSICEAIEGRFFYYLLTRFTTPEEIFGPLSLKALQQDDFCRKTDGYLPTAHVAFLDEIFKSNSSILNSLLTLLNERKFHNGSRVIDVPLLTAFGASNELPEENESLEALYDRFLFRCQVRYVEDEANFLELIFSPDQFKARARLSLQKVREVQEMARRVEVEEDAKKIILEARREFRAKGIHLSDRRWKKIINVLRVAAAAMGKESVDRSMALLLQHMAWDRPEQKGQIRDVLMDLIISGGVSLEKLKNEADDLLSLVQRSVDFKFPLRIRCYDCNEVLDNSKKLYIHKTLYPEHSYYDPYRISLHLRYFGYADLIKVLQDEYGWNFVENTPHRIRSYIMELAGMFERHAQARVKVEEESGDLKGLLDANMWVSRNDKLAIMNRCNNKVSLLKDIERTLRIIESMIERDGQVSLMDRVAAFQAGAQ
ncbi:putative MoxR-like ATPase [Methanocella conradii HZ254]|uniref:MoxR-like ATPase n=1 Tax=Methanocella conradii (strain DSM 24694 / JCM 17849 / CGMCC 1.5162 / HZ254) TaxID=1041930 RepID=H8I8R5_METCZ|nr:AAA family ATPase [Methanocella conradii]AFC99969.1 putative MoxR-like ATPase [Methanocella conradii HZ254]